MSLLNYFKTVNKTQENEQRRRLSTSGNSEREEESSEKKVKLFSEGTRNESENQPIGHNYENIEENVPLRSSDSGFRRTLDRLSAFTYPYDGYSVGLRDSICGLLGRRAIELVQNKARRAIIHHGVFEFRTNRELQSCYSKFVKNSSCQFKFFSEHSGTHIHAIHDCPFSNGTCRCFFGLVFHRKTTDRIEFISENQEILSRIIKYNISKERELRFSSLGAASFSSKLSIENEFIQSGRDESDECSTGRRVESSSDVFGVLWDNQSKQQSIREGQSPVRDIHNSFEDGSRKYQTTNRKRKDNSREWIDVIYSKIMSIFCSPISEFSSTTKWNDDELFQNEVLSKDSVQTALRRVIFKICQFTLTDFHDIYKKCYEVTHVFDDVTNSTITKYNITNNYTWGSYIDKNFNIKYMSLEKSYILLRRLLIWQYAQQYIDEKTFVVNNDLWKHDVFTFVKLLMSILNTEGKTNTLYLLSTPNAGKTLFYDLLSDYFICPAHMKHWNKTNAFPIEELASGRIVFWNEPSYESSAEPELLKLLGGEKISVNVKFKSAKTIGSLPVFISSNERKFPTLPQFEIRIVYNTWRSAPFLQPIGTQRLHPLSLDLLFTDCENFFEQDLRNKK